MTNGLVYIGKIVSVSPIDGADSIESVEAVCGRGGKWRGVVRKGEFSIGGLCQVYLQDSLLPKDDPALAFMERYNWRVRMARFRGAPSEALVMHKTLAGEIGEDVTDLSGVTKYEKPIPASMGGEILGPFPSFVPKTDEPNFQKVPYMVDALRGKMFYATVKVDGSSATVYNHDGHFGVCSRNWELRETPGNAIWRIVREYKLRERLAPEIAIQFEVVGPGIQKNPMGLSKVEPRLFNVYGIPEKAYASLFVVRAASEILGVPMVDTISDGVFRDEITDDDLLKMAEQSYANGRSAEGIVIRPIREEAIPDTGERLSFKVINLLYKGG